MTAAGGVLQDVAGTEAEAPAPSGEASTTVKDSTLVPKAQSSGGGASKGLAIAALVVGALGLLAGSAALITTRRKSTR